MKKDLLSKRRLKKVLFPLLLAVVAISGIVIGQMLGPQIHQALPVTVAVKETLVKKVETEQILPAAEKALEASVAPEAKQTDAKPEDVKIPPLSVELLTPQKQPLKVTVKDTAEPPYVAPDSSPDSSIVLDAPTPQDNGADDGLPNASDELPAASGAKKDQDTPAYEEKGHGIEAVPPAVSANQPLVGKPKIAIIIDDVGLRIADSERAVRLPAAITLSYMPYASHLQEQVDKAKAAGHKIMLHMPMQPLGSDNPGPDALLNGLTDAEITSRLNKALDSFKGYEGINNHMGSKFTANASGMAVVIKILHDRGLFFVDSRTSGQSVGWKIAKDQAVPQASRDVFLDDDQSLASIEAQLTKTEQIAKKRGFAVAIGHPHAATLKALENWSNTIESKGFELVPVQKLIK